MNPRLSPLSAPPGASPLTRAGLAVLRVLLAVFGLLLMLGAVVVGIFAAAGLVVWTLVRGRRPGPVNLRWRTAGMPGTARRQPPGEVVDIEAREVAEPPAR